MRRSWSVTAARSIRHRRHRAAEGAQTLSEATRLEDRERCSRQQEPGERTLLEADYAVRRLTEWHGDIRLGDLTREKARDFRDNLARVPTRLPAT